MERNDWITILIILGVIILSIIILNKPNPEISEEIVKCIASNSTLYVSNNCPHRKNQIKMFGKYAKYLNVIDCSKDFDKCLNAGIMAVPTWIINGKKHTGVQSIEKLKKLIS